VPDTIGRLRAPRLASAPASPARGEEYYDLGLDQLLYWNGTKWIAGAGSGNGGGGGGGAGHTIQDEGAALPARTNLNFKGAGVTATDNGASSSTDVTIPGGMAATVAARAYRNAAVALATGWTKIPLDTVSFDTSGIVQVAQGRIQVQQAGYYQISGGLGEITYAVGDFVCSIYVNGVERNRGSRASVAANWNASEVAATLQLNAGDYVEIWAFCMAAQTLNAGQANNNYLSLSLISSLTATAAPVTAARGYRNAAFTGVAAQWNKIALDTTVFDPGGNLQLANGRYVAPATGQYQVNGETAWQPGAANTNLMSHAAIYVNGALRTTGGVMPYTDSSGYVRANVSDVLNLNAGDYVELYSYTSGAWPLMTGTGPAYNYLSIVQVGQQSQLQSGLTTGAVAARAYRNAALTLAANFVKVPLDAISFDTAGIVQTANGRIQIQTPGYYQVDALVNYVPGASSFFIVSVYVNGVERARGSQIQASVSNNTAFSAADVMQLNAGDYLELWAYGSGPVSPGPSVTYLAVSMVAALPSTPAPVTVARAYRQAALSIGAAAWTKIPVDTVSTDPGGNMALGSGRYVCPASGWYQANLGATLSASAGGAMGVCLYKNGAQVSKEILTEATPTASGVLSAHGSDIVQCNAGDYLEMYVYTSQALSLLVEADVNFLSVVMVGQTAAVYATAMQTAARAYLMAAFSLTSSWHKIPVDTLSFDASGGAMQLATGRYVCPTAGYYSVEGCVVVNNTTNALLIAGIYKNGARVAQGSGLAAVNTYAESHVNVADVVQCNAGDYLELWGYASATEPLFNDPTSNYLSVVKVDVGGQRGAQWYTYTGSGTPPASTFAGEQDGDQCVRSSDSEVFRRVSGAWVDQGYAMGYAMQTAALLYRSAAYSTTAGTQKVPLDATTFDAGGNVTLATSRYVCPVAGYYQVNGVITAGGATSSTQSMQAMIYKNGATACAGGVVGGNPGGIGVPVSAVLQCAAGDYLELYVWAQPAGLALSNSAATVYLSVVKVDVGGRPGPQGPQGQAGPAGAPGTLDVYAQTQNTSAAAQAIPSQAWTIVTLPTLTISKSDGTNADFTANADGSLTILKAGNYSFAAAVFASSALADNTNLNMSLNRKAGATPTTVTDGQFVNSDATYGTSGNNYCSILAAADLVCAVGDRICVFLWQSAAQTSFRIGNFSATRQGAGPQGPPGPTGGNATVPIDPWHTVGSDGGATSLLNGWTGTVQYRKDPLGRVWVRATNASGGATGTSVFTLPVGYRPKTDQVFDNLQASGTAGTYVGVGAAGNVSPTYAGTGVYIDLSFDTETVTQMPTGPTGPTGPQGPPGNPAPTVTSLPGSPVDGQECYFVADATNGIVWHLKYRAASSSTYKWECVGGPPLRADVTTGQTASTASAWVDLATPGPLVTPPLGGDFDVLYGCFMSAAPTSGFIWIAGVGVGGGAPTRMARLDGPSGGGAAVTSTPSDKFRATGIAAGTTFKMQYQYVNVTPTWSQRYLEVRPVRVG
jgi:hypothetical protein